MNQMDLVVLDDNGSKTVNVGDPVILLPCLGNGCMKKFRESNPIFSKAENNIYVKQEFGVTQKIVCPHCGQKMKVRCYKNGSVSLEVR